MPGIVAVGNDMRGDDGVGILAGRMLEERGFDVIFAYESPENVLSEMKKHSSLVVLDAAHFEGDEAFTISSSFEDSGYSHKISLSKISKFTGARLVLVGIKTYNRGLMEGISERAAQNAREAVKVIEVCMAVPGVVLEKGKVDIDGSEKKAKFAVPGLKKGDFVLVHAGVVIDQLSREDYKKIKNSLKGELSCE